MINFNLIYLSPVPALYPCSRASFCGSGSTACPAERSSVSSLSFSLFILEEEYWPVAPSTYTLSCSEPLLKLVSDFSFLSKFQRAKELHLNQHLMRLYSIHLQCQRTLIKLFARNLRNQENLAFIQDGLALTSS